MTQKRVTVELPAEVAVVDVLGVQDSNLRALEHEFPQVNVWMQGDALQLQGPEAQVQAAAARMLSLIRVRGGKPTVSNQEVPRAVLVNTERVIRPKTPGQAAYVRDIEDHTITFAIGPAGTGKTYLAMARAARALLEGEVSRLILTRPAVEAGETLGFLPGTLTDKIDPYLRPLYDALREMLDAGTIQKMMSDGTIEVAALAYMRGRTLNGAFVILDEAQNTTAEQMKMFLTRLGFGSKMVVTGDVTQVDLPSRQTSGLRQVEQILRGIPDVCFTYLSGADVVRHSLVGEIIQAYARHDARHDATNAKPTSSNAPTSPNAPTSEPRPTKTVTEPRPTPHNPIATTESA